MMKLKKLVALLLATCCAVPFTACGPDPDGGDTTQIKFINFNGGIGSVWLEEAADRFMAAKAETSYAAGKKGVSFDITKTMSVGTGSMGSQGYHIFTAEQYETAVPALLAAEGKLLDITDIVQDTTREGGSLEENLFDQVKGSLGFEVDGEFRYYGLPHYESYGGFQYNHSKLLEENEGNGAFIAHPDEIDSIEYSSKYGKINLVASPEAQLSAGPDGIEGTTDDGLPASMEEFIIWLSFFKEEENYAPVNISGGCRNYSNYLSSGFFGSLAGQEQMINYHNSTGWVEVVKREGTGSIVYSTEDIFEGIDYIKRPETEWVQLSEQNGYLAQDMVAKFYTCALYEILEKEGFWTNDSKIGTRSHYDGQAAIFCGTAGGYDECIMTVEASYWFNESEEGGMFDLYEGVTGKKAVDLDLRMYPTPSKVYNNKKTGSSAFDIEAADKFGEVLPGRATTFVDISHCYLFVNANIAEQPEILAAVKDFVAFLYTPDELAAFTVVTGEPRAIKYDLTPAQRQAAGSYVSNLWSLRDNDEGSNIVYCSGTTETFKKIRGEYKLYLSGKPFVGAGSSHFLSAARKGTSTEQMFNGTGIGVTEWNALVG